MRRSWAILGIFLAIISVNGELFAQNRGGGSGQGRSHGGEAGGGGDRLAMDFVRRANSLLQAFNFEHGDLSILQQSLARAQIVSVRELRYCGSQDAVRDQERMLAFSCPGLIQLKMDTGVAGEDSWEKATRESRASNALIAHELFVASGRRQGNLPLDHNYTISITKYGLDVWAAAKAPPVPPPQVPVGPGPGFPSRPIRDNPGEDADIGTWCALAGANCLGTGRTYLFSPRFF